MIEVDNLTVMKDRSFHANILKTEQLRINGTLVGNITYETQLMAGGYVTYVVPEYVSSYLVVVDTDVAAYVAFNEVESNLSYDDSLWRSLRTQEILTTRVCKVSLRSELYGISNGNPINVTVSIYFLE